MTIDPAVFDELRVLGETGAPDFLAELIDQFTREAELLLVQLREAIEVGDALTVGNIAHAIKGSCSQLGGRRLALSCGRLESKATAGSLSDRQNDLLEVEIDYQDLRRTLTAKLTSIDRERPRSLRA
jgi:HPt (histidine-containing phosphotransfer) domain-containing protein